MKLGAVEPLMVVMVADELVVKVIAVGYAPEVPVAENGQTKDDAIP